MNLNQLGFTEQLLTEAAEFPHLTAGRISTQAKGIYKVMTVQDSYHVTLPGKYTYQLDDPFKLPAVGDFVMIKPFPGERKGTIEVLLSRKQAFIRQAAGTETKPQLISTNIDYAFLAMSCNDNFNINRLERYLIAARDSGAKPVILLTKADLADALEKEIMLAEVESIAGDVPVYFMDMHTDDHIETLKTLLQPNRTATILGSSGIGKSTLINKLMGSEVMQTNDVRETDSKGKHTTTHRELLLLPDGGIIIDTPGMREFQLWSTSDNEGLSSEFEDVEALMATCRFNNCTHTNEPGCKVIEALEDGELSKDRYERYIKYQRELSYQERRGNEALARAERDKWKKMSAIGKTNRKVKRK